MNRISPPRSAQRVRSSAEIHDAIADELRRYDDHMRDVRGLAAGTRYNHCRIVAQFLRKKFADGVVTMAKLRAIDIRRFIAHPTKCFMHRHGVPMLVHFFSHSLDPEPP